MALSSDDVDLIVQQTGVKVTPNLTVLEQMKLAASEKGAADLKNALGATDIPTLAQNGVAAASGAVTRPTQTAKPNRRRGADLPEDTKKEIEFLAGKIKGCIERAKYHQQEAGRHAYQAGLYLMQLKEKVGRGRWERWKASNKYFAPRTITEYMAFAEKVDASGAADEVLALGYTEAAKKLGVRSTNKPAPVPAPAPQTPTPQPEAEDDESLDDAFANAIKNAPLIAPVDSQPAPTPASDTSQDAYPVKLPVCNFCFLPDENEDDPDEELDFQRRHVSTLRGLQEQYPNGFVVRFTPSHGTYAYMEQERQTAEADTPAPDPELAEKERRLSERAAEVLAENAKTPDKPVKLKAKGKAKPKANKPDETAEQRRERVLAELEPKPPETKTNANGEN